MGDDVVAHHLLELVRRIGLHELCFRSLSAAHNESRFAQRSAVCDGGDIAEQGVGADQIGGLAYARPRKLRIADKLRRIAARGGCNAVKALRVEKAVFFHVFHHRVLTETHGYLREGAVAGIGERLLKGLRVVRSGAVYLYSCYRVAALAVIRAGEDIRNVLDGGRRRYELEHGAGSK